MTETSSKTPRKYSATFCNLRTSSEFSFRTMIRNVRLNFGKCLENFQKSSGIFGKCLEIFGKLLAVEILLFVSSSIPYGSCISLDAHYVKEAPSRYFSITFES